MHTLCVLTASIYYVVAKVNGFVLLDVDMLPLQGEHWQTDQMRNKCTLLTTPNSYILKKYSRHLNFLSLVNLMFLLKTFVEYFVRIYVINNNTGITAPRHSYSLY